MLVLVPYKHCAAQAHLQLHKVCVTGDVFGLLGVWSGQTGWKTLCEVLTNWCFAPCHYCPCQVPS